MSNIIEPINQYRVEEKDKLQVQFFDKKRQRTNEDQRTVDVLDSNEQPIYDLYVEIYNKDDPYSVLCKKVEGNTVAFNTVQGVVRFNYKEVYPKAFAVYEERKAGKNKENTKLLESEIEIEQLKAQLEKLKKQNEKKESKVSKTEIKTENNLE
jgi:hypothetical protein|tara:strand:- start:5279 stop:5737 length:459 start_codon:yes stop_codon:yes gene_type:complete